MEILLLVCNAGAKIRFYLSPICHNFVSWKKTEDRQKRFQTTVEVTLKV